MNDFVKFVEKQQNCAVCRKKLGVPFVFKEQITSSKFRILFLDFTFNI